MLDELSCKSLVIKKSVTCPGSHEVISVKLSFGRRFLACSPLVVVVLAGASSHRALADGDPAEGHPVATPQVQTLVIHARPSPNLILQGGREVKYVGLFSADANFHGSSKLNRFLDNATRAPVPDTGQNAVPATALHSYVRFKEDYEPPAHAVAIPEVHSLAGRALDSVVTAVYGHRVVLRTPQRVTTDSRQRLIVSDPGIPAVHVLDPKKKTSFSILGGQGRRLQAPAGVAVDAEDNIYIADSSRGLVLVYDQYGTFVRYIGFRSSTVRTFDGADVMARTSPNSVPTSTKLPTSTGLSSETMIPETKLFRLGRILLFRPDPNAVVLALALGIRFVIAKGPNVLLDAFDQMQTAELITYALHTVSCSERYA